jgi:hypothetical protein
MKNKEQEEKITAMMELIRQEEKENVKEEVVLEVLEEKKDVIAELEAKAKQLEEEEMERQKQILLKQRASTANALHSFEPEPQDGHRIVLLSDRSLKKTEGKTLEEYFKVQKFGKDIKGSLKDMTFELMIIPVNKKQGRSFWADSATAIQKDQNTTVVYLSKKGKKLNNIDEIKKTYRADFVRKTLPTTKETGNKFVWTLSIMSDHISKISNSCLPILKVFLDSH